MKTTVELADALMLDARWLADEQELTLRELIERALRDGLAQLLAPREKFVWKNLSYGDPNASTWLRPPFTEDNWAAIRKASYERDSDD